MRFVIVYMYTWLWRTLVMLLAMAVSFFTLNATLEAMKQFAKKKFLNGKRKLTQYDDRIVGDSVQSHIANGPYQFLVLALLNLFL